MVSDISLYLDSLNAFETIPPKSLSKMFTFEN